MKVELKEFAAAGVVTKLAKLNIHTIEDLLFHLPSRYQDRSRVCPIDEMSPGREVFFQGLVASSRATSRPRPMFLVSVTDASGFVNLRFFNFSRNYIRLFKEGVAIRGFGEVRKASSTSLEIIHPELEFVDASGNSEERDLYVPVYPLTSGLYQYELRKIMKKVLRRLVAGEIMKELLPPPIVAEAGGLSLREALCYIHNPPEGADLSELANRKSLAHQRLIYEELLAFSVSVKSSRVLVKRRQARALEKDGGLPAKLESSLSFDLTDAQRRVIGEIAGDLAKSSPMMRLLQGDVGSGKTLVAIMAMLHAVANGFQAAIMVPTEILARQHGDNLEKMLRPIGVKVSVLFSKQSAKDKKTVLAEICSGDACIVVGTHSLFQSAVNFADLALIVVDEQHRFGVHQRFALREKAQAEGYIPHQLIMTATPIPRSLAMAFFADLDYSVVDEIPPGRTPVKTASIPESRRDEVAARAHKFCLAGHRAFWVCPLIEESETLAYQTVSDTYAYLKRKMPDINIGLLHGQSQADERSDTMKAFYKGETQLLVATTVVEVGVDIPAATLMVIENAERFGLSQLHQLRGRVGRGSLPSYCVLLYSPPLVQRARRRLQIMKEHHDGFVIAREDMKLRGCGELLGTRQSGEMRFRVADFTDDYELLGKIPQTAEKILTSYPQLGKALTERWLGAAQEYANV